MLKFGDHTYIWSFIITYVTKPLLGTNFLYHFNLLVDVLGQRLLHARPLDQSLSSLEKIISSSS